MSIIKDVNFYLPQHVPLLDISGLLDVFRQAVHFDSIQPSKNDIIFMMGFDT